MPQKEIKQPPVDGEVIQRRMGYTKTLSVWMKKKSSVMWKTENNDDSSPWKVLRYQGIFTYFSLFFLWQLDYKWNIDRKSNSSLRVQICQDMGFINLLKLDWPPFHFHFPPREMMIRLTFCHWRIMFAFNGIRLPNLLNKQAVEATVQSKQDRHVLRKTVEIFNSFLTALPRSARLPLSTLTSGAQMWSLVPNVFVCVWVCVFLKANVFLLANVVYFSRTLTGGTLITERKHLKGLSYCFKRVNGQFKNISDLWSLCG